MFLYLEREVRERVVAGQSSEGLNTYSDLHSLLTLVGRSDLFTKYTLLLLTGANFGE
jgi:hypothetical protein